MADAVVTLVNSIIKVEVTGAALLAGLVSQATGAVVAAEAARDEATEQAAIATAAARTVVGRFATMAAALTGTADQSFAVVEQTLGFADDLYQNVGGQLVFQGSTPTGQGILLAQRIALEGASMAVTQMPLVPLVSVQPAHGKMFDGRIVPADANTPVSHNAYASTAFAGASGGGTFTPNYTTDSDGKAVHRWQMTAHGHVLNISPALPAGAVAVKLTIKSNAGAGNQNVTAGLYSHNMSLKAITEGAWTDVVVAVTATAGDTLGFWNYSDQLPIDALIKDQCQVYFDGEAVPATEPSRRHALTKRLGFARPGSIPFGPGNSVMPFDGIIDLRDAMGVAPTFAGMSYVMALRQDGASDDNGAVLFTPTATGINYYTVQAGSEYGGLAIRCADAVYNSGSSIQGKGWVIVSGRMSGTESSVFLNGVSVVESTGHIPVAIPWLHVGGSGPGPAGPFNGLSVPPIFDGSHWSDADMAQMVNVVRDLLQLHGDVVPRRNWYFPEGDSNDVAPGSEGIIWGSQIATNLGIQPFFRLRAAASSTYATLMSRLPFTLKLIEQAVAFGDNVIFSESIGTNAVTGGVMLTLAELRAIWDPVRAAGAKCVSVSLKPRGAMDGSTFTNSQRLAFNDVKHNAFVSGYIDGYINLDSDAIIGDPAVWGSGGPGTESTTYVYTDQLHWKNALRLRAVDIGQPVIAGLMV